VQKTAHRNKKIVCVTGSSGLVGRSIVRQLLAENYTVRVLTRKSTFSGPADEVFQGDLNNARDIKPFLFGARLVFHCAAEIRDTSVMWNVNVAGTEKLFNLLHETDVEHFCYISSAGVIGKTRVRQVDENTPCHPETVYERSKWAAEQIVQQGLQGRRIVILRPTNVIDGRQPGALALPMRRTRLDRLKVFLKGGECAHIVHAEDVAQAATYLISHPSETPSCFFVSCDHERFNTYAGLWSLYGAIVNDRRTEGIRPAPHLPLFIPHVLRKILRGRGNPGDVRYSSDKLMSTGFHFPLGVEGAVRRIAASRNTAHS
jgi:nucleoside-diphosphate-sugar epimerase